jgi:hypothetical protein
MAWAEVNAMDKKMAIETWTEAARRAARRAASGRRGEGRERARAKGGSGLVRIGVVGSSHGSQVLGVLASKRGRVAP